MVIPLTATDDNNQAKQQVLSDVARPAQGRAQSRPTTRVGLGPSRTSPQTPPRRSCTTHIKTARTRGPNRRPPLLRGQSRDRLRAARTSARMRRCSAPNPAIGRRPPMHLAGWLLHPAEPYWEPPPPPGPRSSQDILAELAVLERGHQTHPRRQSATTHVLTTRLDLCYSLVPLGYRWMLFRGLTFM